MKKNLWLMLTFMIVLPLLSCSKQQIDDSAITTTIKTKLAAEPNTSTIKIIVETNHGTVTLAGTVPTQLEKSKAEQIARGTNGVASVVNQIDVRPDSIGATNIERKVDEAAKAAGEGISDAVLLTKIKTKYVADGILGTNVDVKDGQATIKGEVRTAAEKTKAEEIARSTEGVKSVKNLLTLRK